jgi:formiminoglutamase
VSGELRRPEVEPPPRRDGDPRLGHLLGAGLEGDASARVVLVGFPTDEGVRRNGGRAGASEGPSALREHLYGLTPDPTRHEAMTALLRHTVDLGDVAVTGDVEEDQERLGVALGPHLAEGAFAVVLGGGHETAYGHFLAQVDAGFAPRILNWDAHPDVRELREGRAHSGSPFRQTLLHASGGCRGYRVAGLQPSSTARDHLAFVKEHGGGWRWRSELDGPAVQEEYRELDPPSMVSFDLDAVDGAHAPGVSAPATDGLPPGLWLEAAEAAGRTDAVRSVDVVELNPRHDVGGRTARLAALTVWRVLAGLTERDGTR